MRWRMEVSSSDSDDTATQRNASLPTTATEEGETDASLVNGQQESSSTANNSQSVLHPDEQQHERLDGLNAAHLASSSDDSIEEEKKESYQDVSTTISVPDTGRKQIHLDAGGSSSMDDDDVDDDDDGMDHAEPPAIPWMPQNEQSTCQFTHVISNYAEKRESGCKKAEYSTTTSDDFGNRWRLIIYVNGNGRASNHHLSLFLQVADADDLPFGWKKNVSYVLTLEHPDGSTQSFAKRNPDKTFKLCPKAIDWGWSQFITSDRIQQEGFVSGDSLTVRASVTVKSSSVCIDSDDSELYLKCAVEEGDAEAVRLCLDHGASVNCEFKDDMYTPLHTACSSGTGPGSMEVLNLLLKEGADGNACNKWKETPLLIAANNGHRAAVEALLKAHADPSMCSEAGWSALTFAAHKGFDDIVALLLVAGAPVDCRVTEDSSTPLHKACAGSKSGHLGAAKLLLEAGADVHALNKWRETPLLTAANHGQSGSVDALLRKGADPCKCTDTGWSPLSIAAYKGHDECVRLLLEEGAPTEEDDRTLSALLQAATKGLPDTVELLLRHGADHTVTTKKGDTALSILVEQNLIDAAVDMVTIYNASIPRCSRDRKKVQRARLLINLRMKQQQRDGKGAHFLKGDEEVTDDESEESKVAQHVENATSTAMVSDKKTKNKVSAEEKARAAEEALLLELEQEDAKAKKEEAKANSKQAKKKKKKERERQQKVKQEQERRELEEREAKERERLKKEKEEQERKARELKKKEEEERQKEEMMEREKAMAAKRKERERRLSEQKEREESVGKAKKSPASPASSVKVTSGQEKAAVLRKPLSETGTKPTMSAGPSAAGPAPARQRNRGWETKSPVGSAHQRDTKTTGAQQMPSLQNSSTQAESPGRTLLMPRPSPAPAVDHNVVGSDGSTQTLPPSGQNAMNRKSPSPTPTNAVANKAPTSPGDLSVEHPAIALLRREKVLGLLQTMSIDVNVVDDLTLKRVLYRWIVRAAHSDDASLDSIIPSWVDHDKLVAFFHRQLISESRRSANVPGQAPSMETLKEAGSSVATLCMGLAEEIAQVRRDIEKRLPHDWTDVSLGMTASDGTRDGSGSIVTVSWANRSQVYLPALTFAALRDRYTGMPNRFLASLFVSKIWYETNRLIVHDTTMDFRLSPDLQACLSTELNVAAELWSDPFSAWSGHVFWGKFEEVDSLFGGQKPFGKYSPGGEQVLASHGGSVSVLLPCDNMVASLYLKRAIDILDSANTANVAVSFAVFLPADCFHNVPNGPTVNHLRQMDSRLADGQESYVRHASILPAGQHCFQTGDGSGTSRVSTSPSLFVILQSTAGRSSYNISESSVARIIQCMCGEFLSPLTEKTIVTPMGFPNSDYSSLHSPLSPHSGYFDGVPALSQSSQPAMGSDFGTIGGRMIAQPFSPADSNSVPNGRRGRLFDLVDDVDEEPGPDMDIVSGMLNNLDVGLFQNGPSSDVDIEAISLMGIGGHPTRSLPPRNSSGNGRFG